jgi:hypothetical protein
MPEIIVEPGVQVSVTEDENARVNVFFGDNTSLALLAQQGAEMARDGAEDARDAAEGFAAEAEATSALVYAALGASVIPASITEETGAFVLQSGGVFEGGYYSDFATANDVEYTSLYARIVDGSGSAMVTVLVDSVPVYGPVEVTDAAAINITGLSIPVDAGSDLVFVFTDVSAGVTAIVSKMKGSFV